MDFLSSIPNILLGYGPPFLFVLTVVVFFHELGHFMVGRWCGVGVKTFSVGFGPEMFGFNDRHGTRWRLSWIPLGGYVKFEGDENAASVPDREAEAGMSADQRARALQFKPVWQRAAVVAAGPIANFILAIVIFSGMFMFAGRVMVAPLVGAVQADSPAMAAGVLKGDVILSVEGAKVRSFSDIQRQIMNRAEMPTAIELERDGKVSVVSVVPKLFEEKTKVGIQRRGLLGIQADTSPANVVVERFGPVAAVGEAFRETWFVLARTGEYLGRVIVGRESADQLGGPIRVAQISGEVAGMGILALINLTAILSISIGFLNLLPIPMLDGGHLMFYAAEAVRGRPLPERAQDVGFRFGLAIVLAMFLFATWNDLWHLVDRYLASRG